MYTLSMYVYEYQNIYIVYNLTDICKEPVEDLGGFFEIR